MRTRALAVIAAAATAGALLTPASHEEASAATPATTTATATATTRVAIASGVSSWKPSRNARLTRVRSGSRAALQIRPRRSTGRATISMRSAPSSTVVPTAGTTVRAKARLRTTQPGRRLTLRITEVSRGRVVASRSTTVRATHRGWRTLTVDLRTTRAGSRIRLETKASRVRGRHVVRLSDVTVTQAPPPAPTAPATVTRPCEDIDYSDPAQGVQTFDEDFDGASIDGSRWRVRDNTFLNQDQAWITKDAVSVHDGYLDIAGHRLPQSQWRTNANALYGAENATRNYSTGYVDTIDRFGQRYGTFEVRAWVPSSATMSRGIWPAFWLRADHQSGEIDPMESYGGPTIRSFDPSSSYEWNSWADTAQGSTSETNKQKTQGRANVGTDKIWQGWHVFGVTWSPSCLRYTYDGRTVGTVDFDAPGTMSYFRGATFADTFHIRLNMQVGSKYWGWADPEHTRDDFSFKVDWVRVHQGRELLGR